MLYDQQDFLILGIKKTSYELWIGRKLNLKCFRTFGSEGYILRNGENLGKFNAKSDLGIFLGYSTLSKAYRVYNQNSQVIQKSSNIVINDTGYDQDVIDNQILTQESIRDNLKYLETIIETPNDILERDIDPKNDEIVPLDDTPEEIRDKYKSKKPKNYPISNFIGNVNEHVATRKQ